MIKKVIKIFLFILIAFLLISCTTRSDEVSGIKIINAPAVLNLNEEVNLETKLLKEEDVNWKSSNPDIISVENGIIKAINYGYSKITASIKNNEYIYSEVIINVFEEKTDINFVYLNILTENTLKINSKTFLKYSFYPQNSTNTKVFFSSSDETILTIDEDGLIETLKIGKAIITISNDYYKLDYEIEVLENVETEKDITIYSVNDFHGMLFETSSGVGAGKLSNYLLNQKNSNTIILSAGDMFQGSAVSSMSRGSSVVDVMNYIGFDAMTIGNHEFDWGISETNKFSDGNLENDEAFFPILVSNVLDKNTNKLASWATPYTTFMKSNLKIGVVGVIGQTQESDILRTYVLDYDFTDELTAIKKYTKILREEESCDIVIVSCHLDTKSINQQIASLTGSEFVDAVINGHTHSEYFGEIYRNGAPLPYVQSGSYGNYIGKITLTVNSKTKKVIDTDVINLKGSNYCHESDPYVSNILKKYQEFIDISNEELGVSGEYINQSSGGLWSANVLQTYFDSDIGIVNVGGIRSNGFPIKENDLITYGDVFEIMPFENMVRTVYLTGDQIINGLLKYSSSYFISSNVDVNNLTINDEKIINTKLYKVCTIDYLFEKTDRPFLSGVDRYDTLILFRDVLAQAIKDCVLENSLFYTLG